MSSCKIIRNVRVLCFDKADTEYETANILISDNKIVAIGPGAEFADNQILDEDINGAGKLAIPGLINGHFHSPANLMKGMLPSLPLEVFMLYEVPPLSEAPPLPQLVYIRTLLGAIEMLKLGITSVQDDAFFVPYPDTASIDALMSAYRDSGMRATVALDQPNIVEYERYPYLADIIPKSVREDMDNAPLPAVGVLTDLYTGFIEKWHKAEKGRLRAAVSCSAPHRVTPDYLKVLSDLSQTHQIPYFIHVLETKVQRVFGDQNMGKSLVQYLKDQDVLTSFVNVIHGIWLDDDDMAMIAEADAVIAHNPVCNLRLGSGIMPFRRISDHGISICLGTDEALADDSINIWNTAKLAGMIHNITESDYKRWPSASEILDCLFRGGARAMGLATEIGSLEVGKQADIVLLDLDAISFTPLNDLRRQLVYCENGSSVSLTMVSGRVIVRDGEFLSGDEQAIKKAAREITKEHSAVLKSANKNAGELETYYREMYLRAAQEPVGMNRWAYRNADA